MKSKHPARLSYEDSYRFLQESGFLEKGAILPLPNRRPRFDDDLTHGVHFFRTWVGNGKPFGLEASDPNFEWPTEVHHFENLTLPRTYFGRSEISRISFKNTDLSESVLCWNDFIEVDFTHADLVECDLRSSLYTRTLFVCANLRNADLRRSTFEECDFTGADLREVKLMRSQAKVLSLAEEQLKVINWQKSKGTEPPGG